VAASADATKRKRAPEYGACFPTAASKRKRDGQHQGGQTIEEQDGLPKIYVRGKE
jgi:hypothetical protein